MTWIATENTNLTAEQIYEVLKHHRLLPESIDTVVCICNGMAYQGRHFVVTEGDGQEVANIFVSDVQEGETASLDFIPVPKYFRSGFDEDLRGAVMPVLTGIFRGSGVRRLNSLVPSSRSKTKRALCSLGFVVEGRMRDAVRFHGKEPEDIRVLGMLSDDLDRSIREG